MIINQELVKKIRHYFTLNIYETKVWLALLSKGVASAGEIAEVSGVPRSRTYDVLESLEKQGFVIQKIGKPVKFVAVKPNVVVENLKLQSKKEAEEKVDVLDSLKGTKEYEQLEVLHKTSLNPTKQEEISSAIKGKSNINSHLREILENAKKEVIISLPYNSFLDKERVLKESLERLKTHGVNVKIAINGAEKDKLKKIEEKYKIKVYTINIKTNFIIVDKEQAMFPLVKKSEDENVEELAIWLNSEFFCSALAHLFELAIKAK